MFCASKNQSSWLSDLNPSYITLISFSFNFLISLVSSVIPKEPVVSQKSGHVFEKRLIQKYIGEHNMCPVTQQPLCLEDLIAVQTSTLLKTIFLYLAATLVKPRAAASSSIPGLLSVFQNEWDALALELFTEKELTASFKQATASALYELDAAKRVIARLLMERDEARTRLNQISITPTAAVVNDNMDIDDTTPLTLALAEIDIRGQVLSAERRKKKSLDSLATAEEISQYAATTSFNSSKSAVTCIAPINAHTTLVLTGNKKGHVSVHDQVSGALVFDKKTSGNALNSVAWVQDNTFMCASEDGSISVYESATGEQWNVKTSFKPHAGLLRCVIHPTRAHLICFYAEQIVLMSLDGAEITRISCESVTCGDVHPDGGLLATGTKLGSIIVWNLATQKQLHTFEGEAKNVSKVLFSENGYSLGSFSEGTSDIQIWDLRKLVLSGTVEIDAGVTDFSWDMSGSYFCASTASSVKVYLNKKWTVVGEYKSEKGTGCVAFGKDARMVMSAAVNGKVSVFSAQV